MNEYSPDLIQIETTTACNAKCPMCPRNVQVRGHGTMETETFYSVVRQAYDLGIRNVLPFIDGEPLADKRMVGFVSDIGRLYPDVTVGWYTNGSLLTDSIILALLGAGNIKHFNVSMQGGTKDVYESNMGLNWERTVNNVSRLVEINEELGRPTEVRINMCVFSKTSDTVKSMRELWGGKASLCFGAFSNFGGMVHDEEGEAPWRKHPRLVCDRATRHVYVYWNGDVGQCCFDLLGSITYGNVKQKGLHEILASEKHTKMREAHRSIRVEDMPTICHYCNSCKFHG